MKLRLFFVTIYALVVCVMYPVSVFAVPEIILVKNKSGNPVFSMQIYGTNEPAHDWYHSDIAYTAEQKKAIERAGIFWMERLKPTGSLPEPVRWSWAQKNELDGSGYLYDIGGLTSSVQGATVPGGTVEPGALALLSYGILSSFPDHPHGQTVLLPVWNTYSSLQERINKRNIELTMMHEMGHALAFTR